MKKCPVCNGIVPRGHGRKPNQIYCSKACFHNRNLKLDKTEVLELLNKTNNVVATAELLGSYKERLHNFIKREGIKRQVIWG